MENISKLWGDTRPLTETIDCLRSMKRLMGCKGSHERIENDGLKYVILDNLWIMKHEGNCQEWHKTTSRDKVERIALWNARRRILELHKTKHVLSTMFIFEYSLADLSFERKSWRTIEEWKESLTNHHVEPPWRTPVIKEWSNEMKTWKELREKPCND